MSKRRRCEVCDWYGEIGDLLRAPSPFDPTDELAACPACKSVGELVVLCDVTGCKLEVSCGTPVPCGYRSTCSEHKPQSSAQQGKDVSDGKT